MQMKEGIVLAAVGLLMLSGTRKNFFFVASNLYGHRDLA